MNTIQIVCLGMLLACSRSFGQTQPSDPKELELKRISNIKQGKKGDEGISNVMIFTLEDFSIIQKNFDAIYSDLMERPFKSEITLNEDKKECVVVYPLVYEPTDDYLKFFKETIGKYNGIMYNYSDYLIVNN